MSKPQRGNKEAKKPKQTKVPVTAAVVPEPGAKAVPAVPERNKRR